MQVRFAHVPRRFWRHLAGNPHRSVVLTLLLVTTACVFIPLSPDMPSWRLDPSWALGINQAVAQGLAFGKDVIFTFGPYGCIFTRSYHPSTDAMMLAGSAYLSLAYWIAIVDLTRDSKRYLPWALWIVLAGLMHSRDALLLSYPLLVGLVCCRSSTRLSEPSRRVSRIGVALLFSSFGLLPLIKGSVSVLCGLIALITCGLFARHKRWDLVIAAIGAALATMVVFWVIAGQPVLALPSYVRSMLPLIFGYADAMAIPGDPREIVCYLVGAAVLLAAVIWQKPTPARPRGFLLGIFLAFLFVAFKAGFVRHDNHALICSTSLLIAAVLFAGALDSVLKPAVVLAAAVVWLYLDGHYLETSIESFKGTIAMTYSSTWHGLRKRLGSDDRLEHEFEATLAGLSKAARIPVLAGTTDVYSYDQAVLIASGNTWNPRPIMQSYAVFDAYLDEHNRQHLAGDTAPDNILFRVETIDGRLPSIDDGASWPILLTRYRPVALDNGFVVLRRRADAGARFDGATLESAIHRLGRKVDVPDVESFVFAEIDVSPSLFGRLAGVLYKPGALQITLQVDSQPARTYRFIANMGKLGIMISPLVENTDEFAMLYGGVSYLTPKKVSSFTIAVVDGRWWWKPSYRVTFKTLTLTPVVDPKQFFPVDRSLGVASDDGVVPTTCDHVVDVIDGMPQPPAAFSASGLLTVSGWMARSVRNAEVPETVFVVLIGGDGKRLLFQTRKVKRDDVAAHFHDPRLSATGYATTIDISTLEGAHALEIAFQDGDRIALCSPSGYVAAIKPARGP